MQRRSALTCETRLKDRLQDECSDRFFYLKLGLHYVSCSVAMTVWLVVKDEGYCWPCPLLLRAVVESLQKIVTNEAAVYMWKLFLLVHNTWFTINISARCLCKTNCGGWERFDSRFSTPCWTGVWWRTLIAFSLWKVVISALRLWLLHSAVCVCVLEGRGCSLTPNVEVSFPC